MKRLGFRFQGVHFEFSDLKRRVQPPEVWRLGPTAIGVFAALQTTSIKYNDRIVHPTLPTLGSRAGGSTGFGKLSKPKLSEKQVKTALRRLKAAGFISDVTQARRGQGQERELLVELVLVNRKLVFLPLAPAQQLPDALLRLKVKGGVQSGPLSWVQSGAQTRAIGTPVPQQSGPQSVAIGTPSVKTVCLAPNSVTLLTEEVAIWTPVAEQSGPPVVEEKTPEEKTPRGEEHLLLTEKSVSAAGAAEIFSSVPTPPTPPRALTIVPPLPPLKAPQAPPAPAVATSGPADLDPDDTPGFFPGQLSTWNGKPQVGPIPADFAAQHGGPKYAHLYWGKPQTAGPIRYGINGMPLRPATGVVCFTTPSPPRVPAKYGDDAAGRELKLKFMLKWYRVALRSRGVEPPRNAGLKGSSLKFFEDALDVFEEQDIAPGAWVAWALDRVLMKLPPNARKRYVPQLKVLLSPKSMVENRWQFREMEADYCTPHLKISPEGQLLMDRFKAMERDVLYSLDRSERAITSIVARHFPESYRAAMKKSQENSMRCEQEVLAQIDRGNWLWPLPSALAPKKRVG